MAEIDCRPLCGGLCGWGGAGHYAQRLRVPDPYYNSVLYVGANPERQFQRNVATLEKVQPPYVILDYSSVAKYGHTLANPVDRFIRLHYSRVHTIAHGAGALEIWERSLGPS
jgi:hypothetical protein